MIDPAPSFGLIILAAGESSRLGSPKQLLEFNGQSLLRHACETAIASLCRPVIVVLGAQSSRLREEIQNLPVNTIENAAWSEGVGTSIKVGLAALTGSENNSSTLQGVVIMLCDQPLLSSEHIDQLVRTHQLTGKAIVASRYGNTLGVPAFFSAAFFGELLSLPNEVGAKRLFNQYPTNVASVPFEGGAVDIDTLEDYAKLQSMGKAPN